MKTVELMINWGYFLLCLVLLAVVIRYPRAAFIEIPLAIVKLPFRIIREELWPVGFILDLFGLVTGRDLNNEYKTRRKRFLTFARANKYILIRGIDELQVKEKMDEGLDSLDKKIALDEFKFMTSDDLTLCTPPASISFYNFHYLVQWMTDGSASTIGLVEGKRLAYTVYDDPETSNLIGQTSTGEKFFISLVDNFEKRQFLRINNDIEIIEENDIENIRRSLSTQLS